ncbi:MAG TPA: RloB family protein [Clostridiales bacterium]|nr:RloB family protein [Clostridiales bacterium]HQP69325.1 RloB family protein [Clostridiales bacterium]
MKLKQAIHIIGEGVTEKYYFKHLKILKDYKYSVSPRFCDSNTCISKIEKKVKEILEADAVAICVFDADVSQRNDVEKDKLEKFRKRYKDNKNVLICDSLPSIEFWFLIHFVQRNKRYSSYGELKKELLKYIESYDKTEKFLKNREWVEKLISGQYKAVQYASELELKGGSYSNIYKAIQFLEK